MNAFEACPSHAEIRAIGTPLRCISEWHRLANLAWQSSDDRAVIASEVPPHVPLLEFARKWHADRAQQAGDASG
ncbi:hypothetical protein NM962_05270 [Mycobacterium sp. SVM_VP21]|nr:hypothetical protein NM962_05270 [Mycobacterium sp. SVM_VP21]